MKEIKLTQGKVALVDDDMFEYLNQWKWYYKRDRRTGYAVRNTGIWPCQKKIYMHRVVMNTPGEMETDHIDHNGCNNQRYNMRNCTHDLNVKNASIRSDNTSGNKGINWYPRYQKWVVRIQVDGRRLHLGYFNTKEEAITAYTNASQKYHGEYSDSGATR